MTIDAEGGGQLTSDDLDGDGRPDIVVSGFQHLLGYEENTQVIGQNGAVLAWRNATGR